MNADALIAHFYLAVTCAGAWNTLLSSSVAEDDSSGMNNAPTVNEAPDTVLRALGSSGIKVAIAGLGGNVFGPPRLDVRQTREVVAEALDLGVNFIDTANVYGQGHSEEFLGLALHHRRDRVVLGTKFNLRELGGGSVATSIRRQAESSLRALRSDYIDLYQLHLPRDDVPMLEILEALDALMAEGKVRAIGACNFSAWRLAEAAAIAQHSGLQPFTTVQNYYHVMARQLEAEVVPYAERTNLGVLPYHPLAGGFLSGKYRPAEAPPPGSRGAHGSPMVTSMLTAQNYAILSSLEQLAAEHGHTIGELAMAWLAAQPAVSTVIAGVSTVDQLRRNVRACAWTLEPAVLSQIDDIVAPGGGVSPERPPYVAAEPRSGTTAPT